MPKFKQKDKKDITQLVCKVGSKESINAGELAFLQSSDFPKLIRPLCENKKNIKTVSYDVSNKQSLKSYISNSHNKDSFLNILTQIAEIIRYCDSNNLSVKKLVYDSSMIFVEPIQKELLFVYFPAENFQNESTIEELLKSIARDVVVPQTVDSEFIIEFRKYVDGMKYFALVDFERRIEALQGNQEKEHQKKKRNSGSFSSDMVFDLFGNDDSQEQEIEEETNSKNCYCNNCNQYFPKGTKFCSECGSNLTPIRGNTEPSNSISVKNELKENDSFNSSKTDNSKKRQTKLIKKVEEITYPSLLRTKTNKEVLISKEIFSIGYDDECDFHFTDNEAISGHHADLYLIDGSEVFIIDNYSTNGTYINDKEIPPCKKVLLHEGDKIELADELFIFKGIEK